MVDQSLVSFIRQSVQQGYDINTIQNHLLSQGYQLRDIQEAVSLIYGSPHVHHTIELSKKSIITIISSCLVVIIGAFFVFSMFSGSDAPLTLLDLSLSSDVESVEAGENFPFRYIATQTGSQKRFDFRMQYEVLDFNNQQVTSMDEEIAIETKVSDSKSIRIPSDTKSGRYVLKATALYDSKKATARINFQVEGLEVDEPEEEPSVEEPEEPVEEPSVEEPEEPVEDPDLEDVPELPQPSRSTQDSHLITEDAVKASVSDVNKAGKLCDSLLEIRKRDKCFEKIAENSQTPSLCANIQSNSKRDTCLMNFAIEGDYSVCPKVENQYLKKSCESLAALNS
ncbi:MAG: hypothetical protein QF915_02360 [Candidatus Woesearchaeota archaeon]|jgi:hypothetical protein|nr:hypothetical protein [Candidatus Woesearchaeota archaeon]MDP7457926.1 hypothetical protein [Candidatus Woesearchaeota archaeon]